LTTARKINVGFGAGFALFSIIFVTGVARNLAWQKSARQVANAHETIERLQEIALASTDAENAVRASGEDLARCLDDLKQAKERASELEKMVSGNAEQQEDALVIRRLIDRQASAMANGARSGNRDDIAAMLSALDQSGFRARLRAAILKMENEQRRIVRDHTSFEERTTGVSRTLLGISALFSICLIVTAAKRMSTDLRKRADVELALMLKEEQYRQVVELAGDIICRTDRQGRFTFFNQSAMGMLHFTEAEVIGRSYLRLIRQDKRRRAERFYLRQFVRKQKSTYHECPIVDGHGVERWVGQNVQLIFEEGRITGFQAIARDITDRKRTELELQKSRAFVERIAATTPGILYVYDLVEHRNVFTNREAIAVLGYNLDEVRQGESVVQNGLPQSLYHPDDQAVVRAHHEALRHAQDGEIRRLEYRARHADGHWVWLSGRETPFERGADGLVRKIVGICQDITARKAAQDKLAYQANFDALTGLANRYHFWTRLQGALRRASIEHSETSICLFDVDHFKDINDRFGHAAGDEVLEAIGNIVRAELRSSDIAGRLGGDEFCFALPGTDNNEAARLAERIRERLSTLAFGMSIGSPFSVTATFGVAGSEPDVDAKEVMEAADRALYRAKSAGRNRVMVEA
jgi:diguanylate cyclase (GGDEF)-like protein/PAS domain S-box-containing protein